MGKSAGPRSGIPDWFHLESYAAAASMTLLDWGLNLLVRRKAITNAASWRSEMAQKQFMEIYDLVRLHGIIPRKAVDALYNDRRRDLALAMSYDDGAGKGLVYSLPVSRIVEILEAIAYDKALKITFDLVIKDRTSDGEGDSQHEDARDILEWYTESLSREPADEIRGVLASSSSDVCVDLDAPDDMLKEAFAEWLKAKRKQISESANPGPATHLRISERDTSHWATFGVLPYLDLVLYQSVEGVKIAQHTIGEELFRDAAGVGNVDTTERVRKTTHNAALDALMVADVVLRQALVEDLSESKSQS